MCIISEVNSKMQEVFTDAFYEASIKSGFFQREGKISTRFRQDISYGLSNQS